MKKDETPFYLTRVECPVCRTVNEFETIKMGAFTESGRDTDFRPTGRQWRNSRYQNTNPLLYFMATCATCFYTREFNRRFREWKDDTAFRTHRQAVVRQRHLAVLAREDSLVRILADALWPTSYPLKTAINKLLLGIVTEEQNDTPSHFDIARWYLRIGWLFREMGDGGAAHLSPRALVRRRLTRILRDLKNDTDQVHRRLESIRHLVDTNLEALAGSPSDTEDQEQCLDLVQGLNDQLDTLVEGIDRLQRQAADCDPKRVVGDDGDSVEEYGEHPSYTAFLNSLKSQWQGVPVNETEALSLSLKHYRQAYREGRNIPPGNPQIQLAYMIGELARRVGQYDVAKEFLNLAVRVGRDWVHKMKTDATKTAMARHIVDLAIEQVHHMREENASIDG